jgi:hypothetical protein
MKDLEYVLEERTRSLIAGLRQLQREKVTALMNTTFDGTCRGEKCLTGVPSQITIEDSKESCPSNEQYFDSHIEFVAPGSVFADLTTVSILLALLAPYTAESNGTLDDGRMEPFEARSTNILKSRCPLQLLATLKN